MTSVTATSARYSRRVTSEDITAPNGRRGSTGANLEPIMTASEEAFAELGFNGASMRTIAKTAGTSLSNLYNYFSSKEELLLAVLERANSALETQITDAITGAEGGPTTQLRAAVTAYVHFAVDNHQAAIVALSEVRYLTDTRRSTIVEARDRTEELFREVIRAGMASGEFTTTLDHDATRAILLLCATIPNWYRQSGSLSVRAVAEVQADFALAIVGATHHRITARQRYGR